MKIKRLMQEAILLSIEEIKGDLERDSDPEAAHIRAKAIKELTEAYRNVMEA